MDGERGKFCGLAVDGQGLHFRFGNRKSEPVLDGLNIRVERSIIYGLLGPSGCGKTTLLKCIVGRHNPSSGSIRIYGKRPGERGFCIPGPGVGFMPQELALYPEITTEETLMYFGRLFHLKYSEIVKRIAFLTSLLNIPDKRKLIKNLSGGQQRRVSLAAALIHKPPLLILDEPTVGVDPVLRRTIWGHLKDLAAENHITIIITTHYVEEARQAHTVGLMRKGRLLAETNPEKLMRQHKALTLEDVFLKLCVGEESEGQTNDNKTNFHEVPLHLKVKADPWVLKDNVVDECHTYSKENGAECEQYKVALLGDTLIPVHLQKSYTCRDQWKFASFRMIALIVKNFVRMKRSIPLLCFQIFVPTIAVIIFCLCMGGEPFDLPISVINMEANDSSAMGTMFLKYVDSRVVSQKPFTNMSSAVSSVKEGKSWGVVHIDQEFTESLTKRFYMGSDVDNETIYKSTVKLHLDLTNKQIAVTLFYKFMQAFEEFSKSMLRQLYKNPMLASPPVILDEPIYGDTDTSFTEFMAPGMILGITYIMAVGLTAMSIIIEKKHGLLDRSWIAGVRSWEIIFSLLSVLFAVMLIQVTLVLLLTFLAYHISSHGSLVWIVIATLLVGLEGMSYGLFISAICIDENTSVMIAMGSFYPILLLSGIIWPTEAMPHYLRSISDFLPLTLISNTMRCVLSRGWSIADNHIWDGYLVAVTWITMTIIISSLIFKMKK